jgi:ubiquinone/menaquinone biosynthesis C-methylase UbiE
MKLGAEPMNPMWFLDEPTLIERPCDGKIFRIKGWIAGSHFARDITVRHANSPEPLFPIDTHSRPDVGKVLGMKGLRDVGFVGECAFEKVRDYDYVEICFTYHDQEFKIVAPVYTGSPHTISNKEKKLNRIMPLLQCPTCKNGDMTQGDKSLTCSNCGSIYPKSKRNVNFLTDDFKVEFDIVDTENVSDLPYDGMIINLINRYHNGVILDCGSGKRDIYYENVVNFEIVDYESSDILGVGEALPFKDNSFDAVLSLAVLEHVKNPFQCAEEIKRVLKPGGTLYCQIAFLQPFHGYPHHYFNMTQSGFRNLFGDGLKVEELSVLNFGQPIVLLNWFLQRYVDGLPKKERKRFFRKRVKDLLAQPKEYLTESFVTQLSQDRKEELAATNYMIATKIPPKNNDN